MLVCGALLLSPCPVQASVDPVSIRAFVHRADSDYDDLINESDMLGLAHAGQLNLSPKECATRISV